MRLMRPFRCSLFLIPVGLAGLLTGCGGSEAVTIQFPEGTTPVVAPANTKGPTGTGGGVTSQGNPAQYSR